ncbi:hypothetical protein [Anaerofustis stercorihominis]|uniref:hypothetical protein n=1 Tax=Anaerofustis stercorihominis TaxID=214853 RepID=UPI00214AD5F5|nr:hypothetical protein [Anaerofustis stercorihominis]MCR2032172.1 hypothetical protein [Anaerofustis stercorihominis]
MKELNNNEETLLEEIINIQNDANKTTFGYFKEKIDNNKDIIYTLKSLEDNGLIKIDNMEDYPINIELTDLGKNYFTDKDIYIKKAKLDKRKIKNKTISLCFISLIFGIIIGILMYHFFII